MSGRNNPLNLISEDKKYVGVNFFYQLIVTAPVSTEYAFNMQHKAAASDLVLRTFDEAHIFRKYSVYVWKNVETSLENQTKGN